MRKNLGDKSREVSEADRKKIVELYDDFEEGEHSKIFEAGDFGYWTITVERPLKLNFACTPDRVEAALEAKPLAKADHGLIREALATVGEQPYMNRELFLGDLKSALKEAGVKLGVPAVKALWTGLSERDESADICLDRKGNPEPDASLRDTENVPFGPEGEAAREQTISDYFESEVKPHLPEAWIDHGKTKTGYEIPFTRHFYKYVPPRPLEEIDADLNKLTGEIMELLREVER
jgi:type I restriction enzyme M protein